MTDGVDTIEQRPRAGDAHQPWFTLGANAVAAALGTDAGLGLDHGEAAERLDRCGPNRITGEKPPSPWAVAPPQLRDPMNIMLVAVVTVSAGIGEVSTAVVVGLLILLNVIPGHSDDGGDGHRHSHGDGSDGDDADPGQADRSGAAPVLHRPAGPRSEQTGEYPWQSTSTATTIAATVLSLWHRPPRPMSTAPPDDNG
jgi:hypothetical protein